MIEAERQEIETIAVESMKVILTGRKYEDQNAKRYAQLIAEDIIDKYKRLYSKTRFLVSALLFPRDQSTVTLFHRGYYRTNYDFQLRVKYTNEDFIWFVIIFAVRETIKTLMNEGSFKSFSSEWEWKMHNILEKYLFGLEYYDDQAAIDRAEIILKEAINAINQTNFLYCFDITITRKGDRVESSSKYLLYDTDYVGFQEMTNGAYYAVFRYGAFLF